MNPRKINLIKTKEEIEIMRKAGKKLGTILQELKSMIKPGLDVWDLEVKFRELCDKLNITPACIGYAPYSLPPFPTGLCVSINHQCVHCYPEKGVILKEGDNINIDTTISLNNLHVDSGITVAVGKISLEKQNLLKTTEKAMWETIQKVRHNVRTGVLSEKMQTIVQSEGYDVIRDYAGHGIGYQMHEFPEIPCFGHKSQGVKLKENMTICIEPLVCMGNPKIVHTSTWKTEMADKKPFAQFEHTVLVKKEGYEILTLV